MGGPSTEREVSLKSGKAVYESLRQEALRVTPIDIKTDNTEENTRLIKSYNIDIAFIALHGRFGEDGQVQRLLDTLKIPYTGSAARASSLAMDKAASRKIFRAKGLNVPRYKTEDRASHHTNPKLYHVNVSMPLVVKPSSHGSSIGLSIVDKKQDLDKAVHLAFSFDEKIIIEEYISGREVTVGILGEKPLPVIEIIPKHRFFDYQAKYHAGLTDYVVPARLETKIIRKIQKTALLAHKLLGCWGCSRVDMILSQDNTPFILEVNTIPGLTETSLLPKAAGVTGINFTQLCLRLLRLAYDKDKA